MSELKESKQYNTIRKLILVGDSGVGKTSIILRLMQEKFNYSVPKTTGVDFHLKPYSLGEHKLKLQIWDTAGQDRYLSITKIFFKGAHFAFLVFDLNNPISFDNIKWWKSQIDSGAPSDIKLILLGNKSDLKREVKTKDIENLCKELNLRYFELSAAKGDNVEAPFEHVRDLVLEEKFEENSTNEADHLENSIIEKPVKKRCC